MDGLTITGYAVIACFGPATREARRVLAWCAMSARNRGGDVVASYAAADAGAAITVTFPHEGDAGRFLALVERLTVSSLASPVDAYSFSAPIVAGGAA